MKITNLTRVLLLVLSVAMMLSLFACGNGAETTEETTAAKAESNTTAATTAAPEKETTEKNDKVETTESEVDEDEITQAKDDTTDAAEATTVAPETDDASENTVASETTVAPEATEGTAESSDTAESETEDTEETTEEKVVCTNHSVTKWAYANDGDAASKLAILSATCTKCGETVTKEATFYVTIEYIYGNDKSNPGNVQLFPNAQDSALLMGSEMVTLGPGRDKCPAEGVQPIAYDSATGFAGMFGICGWAGYVGSSTNDGAAFMAVDETGNVILDWTPVTGILESAGLPLVSAGGTEIDTTLAAAYTDATVSGIRFSHIIDVREYSLLAGKTVDLIFAFVTNEGVAEDVYIPYLVIEDVQIPEAQ